MEKKYKINRKLLLEHGYSPYAIDALEKGLEITYWHRRYEEEFSDIIKPYVDKGYEAFSIDEYPDASRKLYALKHRAYHEGDEVEFVCDLPKAPR